jgi:hypothetical protein
LTGQNLNRSLPQPVVPIESYLLSVTSSTDGLIHPT